MSLPDFVTELKNIIKEKINNIHTAVPGEIVSIDESTGRASVLPKAQMRFSNGKTLDFPIITGVPLVMPQSGVAETSIAFPVSPGDQCLLVFSEQALDYWLGNGSANSQLKYSLSGAIAIPGLMRSISDEVKEATASGSIIIKNKNTKITVTEASVAIRGDVSIDGNLSITGEITTATG